MAGRSLINSKNKNGPRTLPRGTPLIHDKIQQCSKFLFALKTLKSHGMPTAELREIYRATTLSSLLYAAPAWWGFTLAEDRLRLDSFLNRSVKAGYYDSSSPTVEQIVSVAESNLFKAVTSNPNHVLHHLLPMQSTQPYKLRPRPHIYSLPAKTSSLVDKNFLCVCSIVTHTSICYSHYNL